MVQKVPYVSAGSGRRMMARTLTSSGSRLAGRVPFVLPRGLSGAGGRAPAPGPGLEFDSSSLPFVPYEAAKRMRLGGLGLTSIGPPVGAGVGAGAGIGASQGATIGSAIVPGIGTAIGAVIGAVGGAIAGAIGKKDPEQYSFDAAVSLWQSNPNAVYSIGNKYLPLAGLFDLSLKNPHIPIYQKYGRMGEQKFVTDMVNQVYRAAQTGVIGPNDTALSVMSKVVQPWIDSWGYGAMVDPHADLINRLMVGMINDYVAGGQTNWRAVGGDYPFGSLPAFSLPAAKAAPPPAQVAAPAPPPPVQQSIPPAQTYVPTPVQTVAPAQPPVVANVSPSGTTLQLGSNGTLFTAEGSWTINASSLDSYGNALVNLNGQATSGHARLLVVLNGAIHLLNTAGWFGWSGGTWAQEAEPAQATAAGLPPQWTAPVTAPSTPQCTAPLVWNGTACVMPNTAPAGTSTTAIVNPNPGPPPTAAVPSGYNAVGNDQNGNPIFANAQGVLYSWNGTAMVQFTGQLASGSSQAAQMQAAIQQALAQGYNSAQAAQSAIAQQQAAGNTVPPALQAQVDTQAATTAAAPTTAPATTTPTTAGVGGALSGTGGILAVAFTVLGLMFATARPAGKSKRGRRRG